MSCIACDKGSPIVKHYYLHAEKVNGEKIQLKVSKNYHELVTQFLKNNPGAKLVIKD